MVARAFFLRKLPGRPAPIFPTKRRQDSSSCRRDAGAPLFHPIIQILALTLTTLLFSSCLVIRLPEPPEKEVRRVEVSTSSQNIPVGKNNRAPDVLVWLIADNLHTGMVFEYEWLIESGFIPPKGFGNPKYVTLSWGDRIAYVERRLDNPIKVIHALFIPSASVTEFIPINWHVTEVCPHQRIWRKSVPRENGPALAAFLNHSNRMGETGRPIVTAPSSWGNGVILESRHTYYFPRVCNIWTAQLIEALGGKMNLWMSTSANGVIRQAEKSPNDFEQIWWGSGEKP